MNVLDQMVEAVKPGGDVLDLQVIRPNPIVETDGRVVCEIDGEPLFRMADAATGAVDALIRIETLVEQAIDEHDVREHFDDGPDLIAPTRPSGGNSRTRRCQPCARCHGLASCASAAACAVSACVDPSLLTV